MLERRLTLLQEEHTKMLADLHKELETVKCKNRGATKFIPKL